VVNGCGVNAVAVANIKAAKDNFILSVYFYVAYFKNVPLKTAEI
jgi:hypothetical protein